jgi:exopolysaccharide biosynthesis polyprenyl glycosylphosphotransferase
MPLILAVLEGSSLFIVACGVAFLWDHSILVDWVEIAAVLAQGLAISGCCIASFYYNDLYDLRIVRSFRALAFRLLRSSVIVFILLAAFYLLSPHRKMAGWPFIASLLTIVGLPLLIRAIYYAIMNRSLLAERVLILGTSPLARKIAQEIESAPHLRYSIVGIVDDSANTVTDPLGAPPHSMYPIVGPLGHGTKIIEELRPDRIVVALQERRGRLPISDLLNSWVTGILVEDGIEAYEHITRKLAIESLCPSALIFSKDFKKPRLQLALRRAISLAVAILSLTLTVPLMAVIALLIKLDSQGPVFFLQDRAGLGGRIFRLIKFRTMYQAAAEDIESVWNRDVTSRVTPLGKWLRKLRLDELPQFINILKGDMDLVGPRPEMASNVQIMTEHIPYYSLRHMIRPGITGWAQVRNGYALSIEEVTEKLRYDLYYLKHMSFWFDLRILLDTMKVVLSGWGT